MQNNVNLQSSNAQSSAKLNINAENTQPTKFELDREKESQAFLDGKVSTKVYTTVPQINILIDGLYDEFILHDIRNAVDQVLKFHDR